MKEVFANFMAAKIVNPAFPNVNHDLRFLVSHYPSAYAVDRTAGTHPIRQELANLDEAGSLYGTIIYDKAPIVMRQLERILGADELKDGLREYLKKFEFANATWPDLITILDSRTAVDLAAWSHAWVEEPGRPTITTVRDKQRVGFLQTLPVRTQEIQVSLGSTSLPFQLKGERTDLSLPREVGTPELILP